jgi:hypothetical protein
VSLHVFSSSAVIPLGGRGCGSRQRNTWSDSQISSVPLGARMRMISSMNRCVSSPMCTVNDKSFSMIYSNSLFSNGQGKRRKSCCMNLQFTPWRRRSGASGAKSRPVNSTLGCPKLVNHSWQVPVQKALPQPNSKTLFGTSFAMLGTQDGLPRIVAPSNVRSD